MCLIFSAIVPMISLFAFLFFIYKYHIDKYNLTFVYNKEFEGGGVIKKRVIPFTFFGIYVFQILNIGFFTLKFTRNYLIAGVVFLFIQTAILLIIRGFIERKKKEKRTRNNPF